MLAFFTALRILVIMDMFKLLSRGIKSKNRPVSGKETVLPSAAGTSQNPQLFHDPIPEQRGKKRKRNVEKSIEQDAEVEDEELDFFAAKGKTTKTKKTPKDDFAKVPKVEQSPPASLRDEDECRQILRSHRLKLMLLSSSKLPPQKVKKSKKSKPNKKAENLKNKDLYPQPLEAFEELRSTYGISKRLAENIAVQGYKIPTEVQMGSLPLLLQPATALKNSTAELGDHDGISNIDLLAVAPTGSGKTLAFLIPVVDGIIQRRRENVDAGHVLQAIIVAPTKELANQIANEGKKLCLGTGIRVSRMRKGMNVCTQRETTSTGLEEESSGEENSDEEDADKITSAPVVKSEILITTPGLLLSSLSTGIVQKYNSLPTVRTLVLDEADWLLDSQFKDETLGIWGACTNPDLRVTLWSATMGSNIETIAAAEIESRRAKLGIQNESSIVRLIVGLKDSAIPNVTHRLVYAATEAGKLLGIRQLLHPASSSKDAGQSLRPPFLVFTQNIPRAEALHKELLYDIPAEAGGSARIAVLHSNLADSARDAIMTRFRNGEIWVLITTDILSRGVDFRGINGVVSYDVPNSGATYIHRVGRTGRAGRNGGVAVTFYTKEDIPYVKNIANIIAASEKAAGKPAGEASMQKWLLDALPTPSKEEKKRLKKYGVEARNPGAGAGKEGKDAKGSKGAKGRMQISTKSGYERKLENNRRGAIEGSRRRGQIVDAEGGGGEGGPAEDSEWGGIED